MVDQIKIAYKSLQLRLLDFRKIMQKIQPHCSISTQQCDILFMLLVDQFLIGFYNLPVTWELDTWVS